MDGVGTEPRENADCGSETDRNQPGFSGLHVPIRSGPARPAVSLSECGSIEEVPEERTGDAAGYDQQPVLFQADSRSHQGPQPESRGLGCLLSVRLSKSSFRQYQFLRARTFADSSPSPQSTSLSCAQRRQSLRAP